jgi:predicted dehydrogenase
VKDLRAGVIGVGHLGQHHARLYASIPGVTLVGVTDQSIERGQEIAGRHAAQFYRSPEELLKAVDLVSVAVPTSSHYAVAKLCLEAGKHVLVEKPITVQPAEAHELVALARAKGRRLQVGTVNASTRSCGSCGRTFSARCLSRDIGRVGTARAGRTWTWYWI